MEQGRFRSTGRVRRFAGIKASTTLGLIPPASGATSGCQQEQSPYYRRRLRLSHFASATFSAFQDGESTRRDSDSFTPVSAVKSTYGE